MTFDEFRIKVNAVTGGNVLLSFRLIPGADIYVKAVYGRCFLTLFL